LYEKGIKNKYVWNILRDNIRAPKMVVGDIEAQVETAKIGMKRYIEIVNKYGLYAVENTADELMTYSEKLMRETIKKLPDGEYSAEGLMDGFLDSEDPADKDLKVAVTLKIKNDKLIVDLTGTSPQLDNKPINMPLIGTVDIAIY